MAVTLAKTTDGKDHAVMGAGEREGRPLPAPLMVAGVPVARVQGALFRVSGVVFRGVPLWCIAVEQEPDGSGQVYAIAKHGGRVPMGTPGRFEAVRCAVLRWAVISGILTGVARMR